MFLTFPYPEPWAVKREGFRTGPFRRFWDVFLICDREFHPGFPDALYETYGMSTEVYRRCMRKKFPEKNQ